MGRGGLAAVAAALCAALALWAARGGGAGSDARLAPARAALEALERAGAEEGRGRPRVALGFGACHDVFVEAVRFLNETALSGEPRHYQDITSESDFLRSFAYYFRHGAATERFISNMAFFDELVVRAKKLESRWSLGGNAPLMAKRFHTEGWSVLLAAKMSKTLKQYIPKDIEVVGEESVKDDVHMILEYKANDKWGPYTAPRANRYILHNDENNPMISTLEKFKDRLPSYNPHLLVISGLQMMDNYPFKEGVREKRLNLIKEQMIAQPKTSLVHFEMASYVELELLQHLTNLIIPHADSIGMNEQELTNLQNVLQYGNVSFISDSNPRVATALDQMRHVFRLIRKNSEQIKSRSLLSRLHVHTLAYQAILTVKNSAWKKTKSAAAKASLTAHRYVCNSDNVSLEKSKLILDDSFSTSAEKNQFRIFLDPSAPVPCWEEALEGADVQICVAPVLICTEAQLTAGAGDNISAAGLVLQVE